MGVSSRHTNFLSKELMRVLTTPSKIANVFDWKKQMGGSLATIDVHSDRIGVTIISNTKSSSSSNTESSVSAAATIHTSYSFPIRPKGKQKIPDSSRQLLSDVVHKYKVCGMIVVWPIQQDTGLMGVSCGRTLYIIEELLASSLQHHQQQQQQQQQMLSTPTQTESVLLSPIFTPNRKICLWDSRSSSSKHSGVHQQQQHHHHDDQHKDQQLDTTNNEMDLFGRSAVYARTPPSSKKEYHASHDQYHPDESITIAKVWEDFMETNWPTIYHAQQQQNVPNIQQQQAQQSMMESSHDSTNKDEQKQKKKDGNFHHHQQQQQRTTLVAA